ncbi:hypothetical protein N7471_001214 [Penicillium samsonianum]|uniref:uncharacterized protein n=1 Tax=Penicillium samsonianum TaxID=1882272 RepID=UPI002547B5A3|nr:uncharacterized protein N7471_001214 [Penicillium samsonianum]KAJ6150015.1 hypothetical protein N7471_001214 [Penicillium samsonianum]
MHLCSTHTLWGKPAPLHLLRYSSTPTLKELGYHVIDSSIDTGDFEFGDAERSLEEFKDRMQHGGTITLAYDVLGHTVHWLIPRMLEAIHDSKLTPVTVGDCLGHPKTNWYRTITPVQGEERPSFLRQEASVLKNNIDISREEL